jgi:cation:H+ antiporter
VSIGLLAIGLVLLVVGGELLVRGASRLAATIGISPLVVGLTVVAFGTSAPEAAVSAQAAVGGQPDLALGNVVGSNIFNILFILGATALIAPVIVAQRLLWLDVPILIGVSILVLVLALDGGFSQLDGMLLLAGIVVYTVFAVRESRRESPEVAAEYAREFSTKANGVGRWVINGALILGGLALLVLGARWLVEGATDVARALGVSELLIGLTIVAAGTSLPEVAASLIAAFRGERDIAAGNVIGSNLFNLLFVLGLASVVAPEGVPVPPAVVRFDLLVMLAATIACLPILFTGHGIDRWEGLVFVGYYVAYTVFLFLQAEQHAALPVFGAVMLQFVVPITVVTLLVLFVRSVRTRSQNAG